MIKKGRIFCGLWLLLGSCHLYTKIAGNDQIGLSSAKCQLLLKGYCKEYSVPSDILLVLLYFLHGNRLQYRTKPLPDDLSEQDLSGYDFTGCSFTYTNLTGTILERAILTNTICNYLPSFRKNFSQRYQGRVAKSILFGKVAVMKELEDILACYPYLKNDEDKGRLLKIACGFSRLPLYQNLIFGIKWQYWSCCLLLLKRRIGKVNEKQLYCFLQGSLEHDAENYCWSTLFPSTKVGICLKKPHAQFDKYLKELQTGLTTYECASKYLIGFTYYQEKVTKNINGLKKAYPDIKNDTLQQEACDIASGLARTFQLSRINFLYYYLAYQNRLIRLKELTGVDAINYSPISIHFSSSKYEWR